MNTEKVLQNTISNMNMKNSLQVVVDDIVLKNQYQVKKINDKLVTLSVLFADYKVMYMKETKQTDLDEFKQVLIRDLTKCVRALPDTEGFVVGDWHIERVDDYHREFTEEQKQDQRKYGFNFIPAIHKVIVFTNNVTGYEFTLQTKLRGSKN